MHKKSPQADPNPNHVLIFPTLLLQNEHCLNYNYAYDEEESQMEYDSSIVAGDISDSSPEGTEG